MSNMDYDEIEGMEIDDIDFNSGQSARQVPPLKHVESVETILGNIVNKDSIPKENLRRALDAKKSERKELLEQWNKAKESLDDSVKETLFFEDQLERSADELKRMLGEMPFQKRLESVPGILEKMFINRDSILTENLVRALKNKESEREKLLEPYKKAKESFVHWFSETLFFECQLNRNAEALERIRGTMPADCLGED